MKKLELRTMEYRLPGGSITELYTSLLNNEENVRALRRLIGENLRRMDRKAFEARDYSFIHPTDAYDILCALMRIDDICERFRIGTHASTYACDAD